MGAALVVPIKALVQGPANRGARGDAPGRANRDFSSIVRATGRAGFDPAPMPLLTMPINHPRLAGAAALLFAVLAAHWVGLQAQPPTPAGLQPPAAMQWRVLSLSPLATASPLAALLDAQLADPLDAPLAATLAAPPAAPPAAPLAAPPAAPLAAQMAAKLAARSTAPPAFSAPPRTQEPRASDVPRPRPPAANMAQAEGKQADSLTPAVAEAPAPAPAPTPAPAPAPTPTPTPNPNPNPNPNLAAPATPAPAVGPLEITPTASAAEPPTPPVYATQPPPPSTRHYSLQRGAQRSPARLVWAPDGQTYSLSLQAEGGDLDGLGAASRGHLGHAGLVPERFVDRRRGRDQRAANFSRERGEVRGSGGGQPWPWPEGGQDRLSWLLQLAAVLQANPNLARPGAELVLAVAGPRGAPAVWVFQVLGTGEVPLADGRRAVGLALQRRPQRPYDLQVDVWLDPADHHLPLRLLLAAPPGPWSTEWQLQPQPRP